jgi:hypothetical protein
MARFNIRLTHRAEGAAHRGGIQSPLIHVASRTFCILRLGRLGMFGFKLERTGPIWGLVGFIIGAALSGTAVGALGHSAATAPPPQSSQTGTMIEAATTVATLPQRVVLLAVKKDEIEAAINDFPVGVQQKIRKDVAKGKYRLLWLTTWDWDMGGDTGNTISVLSDGYRRFVRLNGHRTRIAVPEPQTGYIELRGEVTEDGNISISVLSGTQPIALPRMALGQSIKINIDN